MNLGVLQTCVRAWRTQEAPEPDVAQKLFQAPYERTEEDEKRSRLKEAARDVAEGNLTLEELTKVIHNARTDRNNRLATQGAFYSPPDQPTMYQFDMEAFQRSAEAIARNRERTAALMRNAKPLSSSEINNGILKIAVWKSQILRLCALNAAKSCGQDRA